MVQPLNQITAENEELRRTWL